MKPNRSILFLKFWASDVRDLTEAEQQSEVNVAEGQREAKILESEGGLIERTNRAKGDAEAITTRANATAQG